MQTDNRQGKNLVHSFRGRSSTSGEGIGHDEWDKWLFLMQHHGVPTRLLDWTESPLIALHFALFDKQTDDDATVWVLDPTRLNEKILGGRWFPDRNDPNYRYRFLRAFYRKPERLPWEVHVDTDKVKRTDLPLAITPIVMHPRMVAQQSAFTIHGDDHRSLNEILKDRALDHLVSKITIPSESVSEINFDLVKCGVSRASIFPDLDGLAADILSKTQLKLKWR